ncbi:indolepyruvate ferredoxin oxidoreductase beta subunit [Roseivivax lentus]|uniref:Indolepyruvate ferredoxin oxidoreductase beta subunit n=1 Tax=Roseivivax lentus TaxID=633194 RepID=A0A1N7PTU1_9RHOB|nr:indolepyruvate oxidoreductase subunit beta family protein [Roseivivax lentus]SIT14034.1 indolepyruvate ferredoxin oxidoreductase beta subunit [Roseivivax lentus]
MNDASPHLAPRPRDARVDGIISIAIMAVGGQGGGVLTGWIERLARSQGYNVQATSVAGVAQRTGATIYYIEMAPSEGDLRPVFSLAPAQGDVDILIAAEMMEAGRAIDRGFVTPDRTTLIASAHRALAVSEKVVPGDGTAAAAEVQAAAEIAAQRLILADMEHLARAQGSVISSSLFGALAGSGRLPFPRAAFEQAIRDSGKAVEASLSAFAAGFDAAQGKTEETGHDGAQTPDASARVPPALRRDWEALQARLAALPAEVTEMARAGLRKVVEFQDLAYGAAYLARLEDIAAEDSAAHDHAFTREAAKYLANAMAYDDVIRVADLKTRAARYSRIEDEMGAGEGRVMHLSEYMHPRADEIVGLMPERLGRRLSENPKAMARIDWLFNRGRRLRSDGVLAFLALYTLGGLKGWRLRTLRHAQEWAHIEDWLSRANAARARNYALGVEVLRTRRLIKGYSDTHARGLSKYDRVMDGIDLVAHREDAADWAARLRNAALQDETGQALDGALKTVRSFTERTDNN